MWLWWKKWRIWEVVGLEMENYRGGTKLWCMVMKDIGVKMLVVSLSRTYTKFFLKTRSFCSITWLSCRNSSKLKNMYGKELVMEVSCGGWLENVENSARVPSGPFWSSWANLFGRWYKMNFSTYLVLFFVLLAHKSRWGKNNFSSLFFSHFSFFIFYFFSFWG